MCPYRILDFDFPSVRILYILLRFEEGEEETTLFIKSWTFRTYDLIEWKTVMYFCLSVCAERERRSCGWNPIYLRLNGENAIFRRVCSLYALFEPDTENRFIKHFSHFGYWETNETKNEQLFSEILYTPEKNCIVTLDTAPSTLYIDVSTFCIDIGYHNFPINFLHSFCFYTVNNEWNLMKMGKFNCIRYWIETIVSLQRQH